MACSVSFSDHCQSDSLIQNPQFIGLLVFQYGVEVQLSKRDLSQLRLDSLKFSVSNHYRDDCVCASFGMRVKGLWVIIVPSTHSFFFEIWQLNPLE